MLHRKQGSCLWYSVFLVQELNFSFSYSFSTIVTSIKVPPNFVLVILSSSNSVLVTVICTEVVVLVLV